jgi:UDP-2-acetamido-2-deoxy-ribo-hexuluronate aminotransferase
MKALRLRNHGAIKKYDHKFPGRNSRLDTIQAGILNIKLKNYKKVIQKRNLLANIYFKELSELKQINLLKLDKKNLNIFHQFVIRTNNRNKLRAYLEKNKIQTMVHYPYMLNELKFFNNKKKLNNSHNLGKKLLSLPISEEHTENEIKFISSKIKKFYQN